MSKIATKWIQDDAVTAAKLNADTAGDGLVQNGGTGALDVNVDDSTIEVATDVVQVKDLGITTGKLAGTSVTAAKLGADVAGNGLTGGNGSAIAALADTTGGSNLATVINISANGIAVRIDDDTITENGSNQLAVGANSIGANEIDETDNYTWTGTHDFTGSSGITVPTPSGDNDAVNKAYADGLRAGVSIKDPAKALADSNQALSGLPSNIDGVTSWSAGDRVLLTNQTTGSQNGIWEVQTGAWTRPEDFDTNDSGAGAQIWINQGTSYGDSQWTCTTDPPNDVIDTDSLTFTQTSGAGQITAGTGLTKIGNIIHVGDGSTGNISGINRTANEIAAAVDDSTIAIVSNLLEVKDLGITTGKLAGTSVTAAKLGVDVAGDGLTGGNGSDLDVDPDTVGGSNLATVINVSANGVAVRIDDSTIGENGSNQLYVPAGGITETQLNSSVAGLGISGGGGSALAFDSQEFTAETSADDADEVVIWDDSISAHRRMTRGNFLQGTGAVRVQEMHTVSAGEQTAGYFDLSNTPVSPGNVEVSPVGGPPQVNKQNVGGTGATPDFDVLSSTQLHINNNGAASGLTGDIASGDILMITYTY